MDVDNVFELLVFGVELLDNFKLGLGIFKLVGLDLLVFFKGVILLKLLFDGGMGRGFRVCEKNCFRFGGVMVVGDDEDFFKLLVFKYYDWKFCVSFGCCVGLMRLR